MLEIETSRRWFDLSSLFGKSNIRAVVSRRQEHLTGIPLAEHRRRLAELLSIPEASIAIPQQVHGTGVDLARKGQIHAQTDGLITQDPQTALSLQTADCAPVFLFHEGLHLRALIHAGWRGLTKGIIGNLVSKVSQQVGDLSELRIVIGPTVCVECYEVGPEVAALFPASIVKPSLHGKFLLDLAGAVRHFLGVCGIGIDQIDVLNICTVTDPGCHSYRRDGHKAGRMISFFYELNRGQ